MLIKSIGIIILGFMTGVLIGKKDFILGILVLIGTTCMLMGSWLEKNKLTEELTAKK